MGVYSRSLQIRRVEEDPAAAEGISVTLVWRILQEQSLYPYHIQRLQILTPPDHHARVGFCQWHLTKCIVNMQFVASILFTDKTGFTRNSILNFHNIHMWVGNNTHSTVASRHQQRVSICLHGHLR